VKQALLPTPQPGDIAAMAHKAADVKEAIESADATASYRPYLNPIENVFSKLKFNTLSTTFTSFSSPK